MDANIALIPDASISPRVVEQAIVYWARCEAYGGEFPAFRLGADGPHFRQVFIRYKKIRNNPGDRKRCGWFSGNTITLFGYVRTAKGHLLHCGTLSQNLAHELGHVLGLADAPSRAACSPYIMSDLDSDNLYRRAVMAQECRVIESRWVRHRDVRRPADARIAQTPDTASRQARRPADQEQ